MDKLQKWLEFAKHYQTESFWKQIFDENNPSSSINPKNNPFTMAQAYIPKCDLYEADGTLIVEIEVPGLKKEDIHVAINEQILTITGEFKTLKSAQKYHVKERANRKFKKELTLPFPIQLSKSRSELSNGLLILQMPISHDEKENIPVVLDESPLE